MHKPATTKSSLWVMILLSCFAWAPATYPGYWQALDGFLPAFNLVTLQRVAAIGTTPDLWRGEGIGAYLVPHLLFRLGIAPVVAVRTTFALIILAGGIGIYLWLKERAGERGAALGGLLYMALPPLLATIYVGGQIADAMVLGLLPWLLYNSTAIASAKRVGQRTLLALITLLLLLWLWLSQAGLALLASLLLLIYVLFVLRNRWAIVSLSLGAIAGGATLLPSLSLTAPSTVKFDDHFAYVFQLLRNSWQVAPSSVGWQDQYPLQLGMVALTLSVIALWLWRTTNTALSPETRCLLIFSAIGALLLVSLSLNFSALFWQWSGAQRLLTYPWQIILLAAPLLVVLPAALPIFLPAFEETPIWAALMLLTLAASYNYFTTDFTRIEPPIQPLAIVGDNEFVLLKAEIDESQPPTVTLTVGWQVLQPLTFDDNLFFQARSEAGDQGTTLAQFDGPPLADRPATSWSAGEIFTATYALNLPNSAALDPVYIFGYYDWRDGARLTFDHGRDDKFTIRSAAK